MKKVVYIPREHINAEIRYSVYKGENFRVDNQVEFSDFVTDSIDKRHFLVAVKMLAETNIPDIISPRISAITLFRSVSNWGLKESRDFVNLLMDMSYRDILK